MHISHILWLITHTLYRLLYQTHCVVFGLLNHFSQKQLLVCGFDLGEVALDAVELWTVWHVEDLGDVQFFKQQLRVLGLVDT